MYQSCTIFLPINDTDIRIKVRIWGAQDSKKYRKMGIREERAAIVKRYCDNPDDEVVELRNAVKSRLASL